MSWADGLDRTGPAYQIASSTNSRIRVLAGPGTGKSFAMKRRVARLLESGVAPEAILPVTFTRVAAEDLHRELSGMGIPGCDRLHGVTLHSLALRILMQNHVLSATGRVPRPLHEFETEPLICDLMKKYKGKKFVKKQIKAYEAAWARLQDEEPGFAPTEIDKNFEDDLIAWLKFHKSMLIGEVIPQLHEYLISNPIADEKSIFNHIVVDEYQDLNKAEQSVIDILSESATTCIVGDDDQSIYSFKHAHPNGIRTWSNTHKGAVDFNLVECHRCPMRVVGMANSLIGRNKQRTKHRTLKPSSSNRQVV